MDTFKRSFVTSLFILLVTVTAFSAGYLTNMYSPSSRIELPLLKEAYQIVKNHGLQELPEGPSLEYGMIRGLLEAYGDQYSVFLEPVRTELESNSLHGSFGGIGVSLGTDDDGNYIMYPFPDSPAEIAGILEGDRLSEVDTMMINAGMNVEDIQAAIRGPVGTNVSITITRPPGYETFEFEVKRAEISLPSVTWHIDSKESRLGVIVVNIIADPTPGEIEKAVEDLKSRGATHFALDLRNNGGGLLNAGIDTARLFLKAGAVIQQQYRGKDVVTYDVEKPGPLSDIPLVVLVNENTASAAEIIAGSIQAQDRAKLIGSPTYGKNTIQLVFSLQDKSSIHITAAEWWIPDLEFPSGEQGLLPDILLTGSSEDPNAALREAASYFFPQS
ncbi:MAG: PDZ domain-containing protein [Chloroflexi bacterium]|nr:MAG: PDZ domain-containing protein [Chloroflexota bacterium]